MMAAGFGGKILLGLVLVILELAIATGLDKKVEAAAVELSADWLTKLTTRF
jgi:cytochrome c-type biogenesis protein